MTPPDNANCSSCMTFLKKPFFSPVRPVGVKVEAVPATRTLFLDFDKDNLQIDSIIAKGGSGSVYHGMYEDTPVAVKLFHETDDFEQEDLSYRQYLQEISALSSLKSPHIIKFIGAFWEGGVRGIVTEYASGGNINRFLRDSNTRLPYTTVLKMALDIARGMSYLHSKNMIHRDLKSENLLIDEKGNVKIADLGDSKFYNSDDNQTAETGTCRWMAPEVIAGLRYDSKADVYSFGIILWELLTGKRPFEGMTNVQVVFAVVTKDLRPEIPEDCPYDFRRLLMSCWSRDSTKRPKFSDIEIMLESMQYFIQGRMLSLQ